MRRNGVNMSFCCGCDEGEGIRQGTSPSAALLVHADIADFPVVEVLVKGDDLIRFEKDDIEFLDAPEGMTVMRVAFTQEDTLLMTGCVYFQVRALDEQGRAFATEIVQSKATGTLERTVLA